MKPVPHATVSDEPPPPALIAEVAESLARGGLVALPTETVYGIAARADLPFSIERLVRLTARPPGTGLTWHVGSSAALTAFPSISPMVRRLVARYWPGPLTLILPGVPRGLESAAHGGWTGVRFPAQQATAALLAALDFPVVMTSANRYRAAAATTVEAVEATFGSELELYIDGGPSRLAEGASVLRLGPAHFDLLREGLFTPEQLRSVAGLKIAFVCTGNTCRSPMAEAIAKKLLAERLAVPTPRLGDFGFHIQSMGVFASAGAPVSKLSQQVLADEGLDLSDHRSRPTLPEEVQRQDRVYCMTRGHFDALRMLLPPGRDKNVDLLDPEGTDVPDPIGGTKQDYRRAADRIRAMIAKRASEWA
jgi:L-threonylcarbamoyladenylate synthase